MTDPNSPDSTPPANEGSPKTNFWEGQFAFIPTYWLVVLGVALLGAVVLSFRNAPSRLPPPGDFGSEATSLAGSVVIGPDGFPVQARERDPNCPVEAVDATYSALKGSLSGYVRSLTAVEKSVKLASSSSLSRFSDIQTPYSGPPPIDSGDKASLEVAHIRFLKSTAVEAANLDREVAEIPGCIADDARFAADAMQKTANALEEYINWNSLIFPDAPSQERRLYQERRNAARSEYTKQRGRITQHLQQIRSASSERAPFF